MCITLANCPSTKIMKEENQEIILPFRVETLFIVVTECHDCRRSGRWLAASSLAVASWQDQLVATSLVWGWGEGEWREGPVLGKRGQRAQAGSAGDWGSFTTILQQLFCCIVKNAEKWRLDSPSQSEKAKVQNCCFVASEYYPLPGWIDLKLPAWVFASLTHQLRCMHKCVSQSRALRSPS